MSTKEIKPNENRVVITPAGVEALAKAGHKVFIEKRQGWAAALPNIPGAVPRTSTFALTNATMPYALKIANMGAEAAMKSDIALKRGLNTYKGKLTYKVVAEARGLEYTSADEVL